MNAESNGELHRVAAFLEGRDIPRLGWPTSVLPPRGIQVAAFERPSTVTVVITGRHSDAAARLDFETREVIVSATGRTETTRSRLRRLALEFVADRNDFDEQAGLDVRPSPQEFDEHDPDTWTEVQLLADVTGSDWYPPTPQERSPAAWNTFYATAHRFNDRVTTPVDAATTLHPVPPQGGRSSGDPATPGPSAPAAG